VCHRESLAGVNEVPAPTLCASEVASRGTLRYSAMAARVFTTDASALLSSPLCSAETGSAAEEVEPESSALVPVPAFVRAARSSCCTTARTAPNSPSVSVAVAVVPDPSVASPSPLAGLSMSPASGGGGSSAPSRLIGVPRNSVVGRDTLGRWNPADAID
jgi:hypothetical protein